MASLRRFPSLAELTSKITAGAEQGSCEIQCDDNLLELIKTEVVDGELQIELLGTSRISPTKGLQLEISAPNVTQLKLSGSTRSSIVGLDQAAFDVALAGSHNLDCAGQVESAQFESAGSCKILAAELKTKSTSIELAGSGTAEVHASDKLSVEIAGSGKVLYLGEPVCQPEHRGLGKDRKDVRTIGLAVM